MVDSIKGPGKRIIITTKPKGKEKTGNKTDSFDKTLKNKSSGSEKAGANTARLNPAQNNLKIIQQQQVNRMQRLQEITKQVQNGTYKLVDPNVLAEKIYQAITDQKTREKFIKKLLQEEAAKNSSVEKGDISDLELKKLVFMIREAQDIPFEDEELEQMIQELS
ncbi:MAG: flagellar biosynthesis anti-sigma factor FlgM [Candidatus Rifleibacteriota bacterium]